MKKNYVRFLALVVIPLFSANLLFSAEPSQKLKLQSNSSRIEWMSYSPNGRYFGVRFGGYSSDSILVWETKGWSLVKDEKVPGIDSFIGWKTACAFSDDESILYVLEKTRIGKLPMSPTGKYMPSGIKLSKDAQPISELNGVYTSGDGNNLYLTYRSKGHKLCLILTQTYDECKTLLEREEKLSEIVYCSCVDVASKRIARASFEISEPPLKKAFLEVYDFNKNERIYLSVGNWEKLLGFKFSQAGDILVSAGMDGYVSSWSVSQNTIPKRFQCSDKWLISFDCGKGGAIVSGTFANDGKPNLFVIDLGGNKKKSSLLIDKVGILGVCFSPKTDSIAVISDDNQLRIYNSKDILQ
jgi:WD40 repeat protein